MIREFLEAIGKTKEQHYQECFDNFHLEVSCE
jgi:hypothetical protein